MDDKSIMGTLGEQKVQAVLDRLYNSTYELVLNKNKYDNEKDMLLVDRNGFLPSLKVEVKTQCWKWSERVLSFKENQIRKITNCDVLFFVQVPINDAIAKKKGWNNYKHKNDGWILVCNNPKALRIKQLLPDKGSKEIRFGISADDEMLIRVRQLTDKSISELQSHSSVGKAA